MDPQQLTDFILQRKWVALAALVIGFIVRLLKSDTKIPIDIPPQWRVWLALGLGAASGVLDKFVEAGNTTWTSALVQGLVAAVVAIISHNVVIDSLNGGKELNVPGLIKPNTPPGPGNPPTLPPPPPPTLPDISTRDSSDSNPSGLARLLFVPAMCLMLFACSLFTAKNVQSALDDAKIACAIENAFLSNEVLDKVCNLLTAEEQAAAHQHAAEHRAGVARAMARQAAAACVPDAGADGGAK